jgi:hypothetical protein
MCGKPGKGRHDTSHHAKAIYQIISSSRSRDIRYKSFHYSKHEKILSHAVNRKWMCGKPGKGRHGTSHHAKAIYQI